MKGYKKNPGLTALIAAIVVGIILIVTGLYIATQNNLLGKSGVDIEVITGAGGMPPDINPGKSLEGEQFSVVFTEPFSSLKNWQDAKEIKRISTTTGRAKIDLPHGKYGVYYIYNGQKVLYDGLSLQNPRNDTPRDEQGPWYIKVNSIGRTKLRFSVNSLPS